MKPLVIIPARGGSKGVPGKNIRLLNKIPLIHYTIAAARELFTDDQIIVSTDDLNIKKIVEQTGLTVPFIRPSDISQDNSSTHDVLIHALKEVEEKGFVPDTIILLQPTSPFRTSFHIKESLELYTDNIDMVVSVKETKSNPYFVLYEENEHGFLRKTKKGNFIRRQDCPKVWELNGAIYIINVKSLKKGSMTEFKKIKKYFMSEIDSLDIDTEIDWDLCELILKNKS